MPIPPLAEQQKIAEILSTCDRVIELKQQLLDEKRKQKQWLMRCLLSKAGTINEVKLSDLCTVICDGDWIESKDQSESGIRLVQTGNVGVGQYLDKDGRARYISEETFDRLHCTEIFEGDVLISRLPDPIGRACRIPKLSTRAITAVDCSILRFKDEQIAEFFLQYATSQDYFNKIAILAGGSTRTRISRKEIEKLTIPVPSDKTSMITISGRLSLADRGILLLEQELEAWQQKKKALMQLLLTGLVRVNA
jgi:type I restriction enzyme S subunit